MMENEKVLYNSISRLVDPSAEEWADFFSQFTSRTVKKNSIYLSEGTVSSHMALICKGCFRMYYVVDGEELCKDFQMEGQFTGSLYSLMSGKPALFNVAAVEDSEILEITGDKLFMMYDRYKTWERFGRKYLEQAFLYKEKREAALLTESAQQRYTHFLEEQPELARRVPQKYIASYLGVKPESLSRIRRNK